MGIATVALQMRTIVRSYLKLSLIRLRFQLGGLLWPDITARHGADLFCTPSPSSRARAFNASDGGAKQLRLVVDDQQIATYVWGEPLTQPYVLFAHGWSSHGLRHLPWIEVLRSAGYAVVAFDQQGHGRSSGRMTTPADFACNLMAVGHRYGPAAAVIGHSMGGLAAAIAMSRGLKAERAILIAPAADPADALRRFARFVGLGVHVQRRMVALLERRTRIPIDELRAQSTAPIIGRAALIVHDLEDREVPWGEGERYARYWPDSRLLTTTGLGHHRIAHDPGVIAASLRFLQGHEVGSRVVSSLNLP